MVIILYKREEIKKSLIKLSKGLGKNIKVIRKNTVIPKIIDLIKPTWLAIEEAAFSEEPNTVERSLR